MAPRAMPDVPEPDEPREHGAHTLRTWEGTVVGRHGQDVFVELGPRMQGVLSVQAFAEPPNEGDVHLFTLRGREEGLWALSLAAERSLVSWEAMERGSVVEARVTGKDPGGLELKVGRLHGFMPLSHTGLPRGKRPETLIGRALICEVLEVDAERQRVLLSRRLVQERERLGTHQRELGHVVPGQVVQGRVTRIEDYGVFVRFGRGLTGLVHASDLAHERPAHPSERVKLGELVEAKVLSVRRSGKRIGLGLKQLTESPWTDLLRSSHRDQLLTGRVVRIAPFGVFAEVRPGVVGLVHRSETGLPRAANLRAHFQPNQELGLRVLELDPERERLALSLLHRDGRPIDPEEPGQARSFEELVEEARERRGSEGDAATGTLGRLLDRALKSRTDAER